MTNKLVAQNKSFCNVPNVRRGAGPIFYSWCPQPFQKSGDITGKPSIVCDRIIDNTVTYVYNINNSGNHLKYVECDYVI